MKIKSLRCDIPRSLYRAEQVRQLDALAIAATTGGGYALMVAAGQAAFAVLRNKFPDCRKLSVICGGGNNGGDGYVVAELALQAGFEVQVLAVVAPGKLTGEAQQAWQQALQAGIRVDPWQDESCFNGEVIVDALLGTGLSGEVRADYAEVIRRINGASLPVLAIDIPSGLAADTGIPLGPAVAAEATITFIGIKQGLMTGKAGDYTGELWFDDLKVAADIFAQVPAQAQQVNLSTAAKWLPARKRSSHKGDFGHVLVIGGDQGFAGAAIMASEAALLAGAGMVSCATRSGNLAAGLSRFPDIMYQDGEQRSVLLGMISRADVIVLGPGLGNQPWGQMCTLAAIESGRPLVIDADGLNHLSAIMNSKSQPCQLPANSIITPHPGEAGRLLSCTTAEVNQNRFIAVSKLAEKFSCTCLLKGFGTVIAGRNFTGNTPAESGQGPLAVVAGHGNPGMAKAGMGDVLSGITGALLAQHMDGFRAAQFAACWHAATADRMSGQTGELGLSASTLVRQLGQSLLALE